MNIRQKFGLSSTEKVKKTKPTHGICCTCQQCGFSYDDCMCEWNNKIEVADYVEKLQAENERLKKLVVGARMPVLCHGEECGCAKVYAERLKRTREKLMSDLEKELKGQVKNEP